MVMIARSWPVALLISLRLFQLERINLCLRFAKILDEQHRVFGNQLSALGSREDRSQSRDDHVDPPRSDRLSAAGCASRELTDEEVDVTVVDFVDSLPC